MRVSDDQAVLHERVLVLAPTGMDAELTAAVLSEEGLPVAVVEDSEALAREIEQGAAIALVASEALDQRGAIVLREVLEQQPPWSEFPILIFISEIEASGRLSPFDVFGPRAHVVLIDRPIHVATLISATRSALRGRQRQYEVRQLLYELEDAARRERQHSEHLASLAEASVAIASARLLDDVLAMLTEQARSLLRATFAVTHATAVDGGSVTSFSSRSGDSTQLEDAFTKYGDALLETVSAPLRVPATEFRASILDERLATLGMTQLRNAIAMPLVIEEETPLGYIVLFDRIEGDFTDEDEAVLTQLAHMASVALQKAKLYREAQDANRAKDDFLATLAHELRTPMTAILGWVQMLKRGHLSTDDVGAALSMIESSTMVQARLVEDLLDVSRIIARKLKIQPAAIELAPLIERILATFRATADEQGVQLLGNVAEEPLSVWGDATRLQQIVWNLLSNSIKFTPAGGTVEVSLVREGSAAVIRVRDTGEGIDPEFLPHVFERFQQADRGSKRSHVGLGLGLAIVQHLVELHGGGVEARSEGVGKGSEFVVSLPIRAVHPLELAETLPEALPQLNGRKILVVDDDADAREVLRVVLSRYGAGVESVASVAEAAEVLRRFDADLVISDIAMPGEDGYAMIRRLRDLHASIGRDIPAVALTGYGREQEQHRILSAGFRRYVQKPVRPADLAAIAAELIES